MGIRDFVKGLRTSAADEDAHDLFRFCCEEGTPISSLAPRELATVVGEITSMRIVPRDGSPWLEASVSDGQASMTILWTGRRTLPGVRPGRRIRFTGRPGTNGARLVVYNPLYELLP